METAKELDVETADLPQNSSDIELPSPDFKNKDALPTSQKSNEEDLNRGDYSQKNSFNDNDDSMHVDSPNEEAPIDVNASNDQAPLNDVNAPIDQNGQNESNASIVQNVSSDVNAPKKENDANDNGVCCTKCSSSNSKGSSSRKRKRSTSFRKLLLRAFSRQWLFQIIFPPHERRDYIELMAKLNSLLPPELQISEILQLSPPPEPIPGPLLNFLYSKRRRVNSSDIDFEIDEALKVHESLIRGFVQQRAKRHREFVGAVENDINKLIEERRNFYGLL